MTCRIRIWSLTHEEVTVVPMVVAAPCAELRAWCADEARARVERKGRAVAARLANVEVHESCDVAPEDLAACARDGKCRI